MQWALILYGLCKSRQNAISSVIYLQIFITVIYLQMLFFCMLFFCRFFCYFCYFFLYVIFLHVIFLQTHQLGLPTNFWTIVYVVVKGSWAKVGSDIFTSLEMTGLQSWSIDFFLFLFSEIEEKINASTLKACHFKASEDITTNFGSETLDNNISKWPKVGRHD